MQGNLTAGSFFLICIAVVLGACGQISLKMGMGAQKIAITTPIETFLGVLQRMAQPYVIMGLLFYVISTFFWLLILSRVRLSVAYPMISMGYILVVILARFILKDPVDWRFAGAGLLFITLGVSFIGLGLGQMSSR